ncbi:MAG: phage shock protein operon transcriptional activator [Pseudomonadota bacterium]
MSDFVENNPLIGESESFHLALNKVSVLAKINKPVLVVGERGTGKELFAARLHYLSDRWDNDYLKLNCSTLTEGILESELFGHEAGSFTGALKKHIGVFEKADNGTLFLDEIANTSLRLQEKILRVIEYGEFTRVGGNINLKTDVRIVAATNIDLPNLASCGQFRFDLLDRLSFDVITIPPLRERGLDIVLLAEHFAMKMVKQIKGDCFYGFSDESKNKLLAHAWSGNVRELRNVIERTVFHAHVNKKKTYEIIINPFESEHKLPGASLDSKDNIDIIQENIKEKGLEEVLDFYLAVDNYKKEILGNALRKNNFNQKKTAYKLGLTYNQFRGLIRKFKIKR